MNISRITLRSNSLNVIVGEQARVTKENVKRQLRKRRPRVLLYNFAHAGRLQSRKRSMRANMSTITLSKMCVAAAARTQHYGLGGKKRDLPGVHARGPSPLSPLADSSMPGMTCTPDGFLSCICLCGSLVVEQRDASHTSLWHEVQ